MSQLPVIPLCGIGCLTFPVSGARSLIASIQQAVQDAPFLAPVLSCNGACGLLPCSLVGQVPTSLQTHEEAQP